MADIVEWLFLAGRLLLGGAFVVHGLGHLLDRAERTTYVGAKGVPSPNLAVPAAGVVLLAGGAGVIAGVLPHTSLALLVAYLVASAFALHDFWNVEEEGMAPTERSRFVQNVALTGACLALYVVPVPWTMGLG